MVGTEDSRIVGPKPNWGRPGRGLVAQHGIALNQEAEIVSMTILADKSVEVPIAGEIAENIPYQFTLGPVEQYLTQIVLAAPVVGNLYN